MSSRLFALVLALGMAARAEAQQIVGLPFTIGTVDVASSTSGHDGDVALVTTPVGGNGPVSVLWYDGGAPPPRLSRLLVANYQVYERDAFISVAPLARGGYVTAWTDFHGDPFFSDVSMRRLNSDTVPIGLETVIASEQLFARAATVAPRGDGFVVVWTDAGRLMVRTFDGTSTPLGGALEIADGVTNGAELWVRPLPNGGLLVVIGPFNTGNVTAVVAGPDLAPVGPPFEVASSSFHVSDVSVSPDGSVAALVGWPLLASGDVNEARLRLLSIPGGAVTEVVVRVAPSGEVTGVSGAFGEGGALLVLWGEQVSGVGRLYARLFDSAGTPIAPIVPLAPESRPQDLRMARRNDGRFFATWYNVNQSRGAILSICAAGSSVCGDGAVSLTCEVCDDGAANNDVVPDACRTDCRPARCGDGVIDGGEACDDGNLVACDGCNPFCELENGTVCGDGVVAPKGCGEQCDDGNGIAGDGCAANCSLERAPGGGSPTTDCWAAWRLENPNNVPLYDKRGFISGKQRCRDNDSACDFDGGVPGACTFHVGVCVNNSAPSGCLPARLQSWIIRSPSEKQALGEPELAAARVALSDAVVPNVVGSGDADDCSPAAAVVVPLRGGPGAYRSGKLTLKTAATLYSGAIDKDSLTLRCDP